VRELKSTVTGKSFQQLTTRSLKNFDRTSAEQRFLNSLWLCHHRYSMRLSLDHSYARDDHMWTAVYYAVGNQCCRIARIICASGGNRWIEHSQLQALGAVAFRLSRLWRQQHNDVVTSFVSRHTRRGTAGANWTPNSREKQRCTSSVFLVRRPTCKNHSTPTKRVN